MHVHAQPLLELPSLPFAAAHATLELGQAPRGAQHQCPREVRGSNRPARPGIRRHPRRARCRRRGRYCCSRPRCSPPPSAAGSARSAPHPPGRSARTSRRPCRQAFAPEPRERTRRPAGWIRLRRVCARNASVSFEYFTRDENFRFQAVFPRGSSSAQMLLAVRFFDKPCARKADAGKSREQRKPGDIMRTGVGGAGSAAIEHPAHQRLATGRPRETRWC